jgi:hypothetical protein
MTTKSKTRKAPAAKTASSWTPNDISEIRGFVARWNFLEANEEFQATISKTEEESEACICQHFDEQKKLEEKLAKLVPETFSDACCLLEFATKIVEEGGRSGHPEIAMLKNARRGISIAERAAEEAARAKIEAAHVQGMARMNETVKGLIEIAGNQSVLAARKPAAAP